MKKRLAILCTHPIQYYAPLFRKLSESGDLDVKVFYGWEGASVRAHDPGFKKSIRWDIPLLEGYDHEFVANSSKSPGSSHYRGIDLPELHQHIDRWKPDFLLVYGWRYKSHLRAMRHYYGRIPVLFRGDSTLLDESPGPRTWLRRRFLRWVYRHVDLALYVGTENRRYYRAHGLQGEQLFFAPHAVDNERFSNAQGADEEAIRRRRRMGIEEIATVFLFVGKLEAKKAPDLLLTAFSEAELNDAHLVFVGSGVLEERLRASAGPNVHFLGFQNQSSMPVVYRIGNVMVLPSRGPGETWGLALNEAMACSRAVIASNRVGAAADLITHGENGWLFAANAVNDLAACLRKAANTGNEGLNRMGQRSLETIDRWSLDLQTQAILGACAAAGAVKR